MMAPRFGRLRLSIPSSHLDVDSWAHGPESEDGESAMFQRSTSKGTSEMVTFHKENFRRERQIEIHCQVHFTPIPFLRRLLMGSLGETLAPRSSNMTRVA